MFQSKVGVRAITLKRRSSGSRAMTSLQILAASWKPSKFTFNFIELVCSCIIWSKTVYLKECVISCITMFNWIWFAAVQFIQCVVVIHENNEMMKNWLIRIGISLTFNGELLMSFGKWWIIFKQFSTLFGCQAASRIQVFFQNTSIFDFNADDVDTKKKFIIACVGVKNVWLSFGTENSIFLFESHIIF